jgi:hypothetical protein
MIDMGRKKRKPLPLDEQTSKKIQVEPGSGGPTPERQPDNEQFVSFLKKADKDNKATIKKLTDKLEKKNAENSTAASALAHFKAETGYLKSICLAVGIVTFIGSSFAAIAEARAVDIQVLNVIASSCTAAAGLIAACISFGKGKAPES